MPVRDRNDTALLKATRTGDGAAFSEFYRRGHLARVLPDGGAAPARLRITQTGEMQQRPGRKTLRFKAR